MFRRAGNGSLEPVRQRLTRKPRHANRISQSETAQQDNRDNRLPPRLGSLLRHHFFIDRRKRTRLNRKRRRVLRKQPHPSKRQRHPSSHQKPHEDNQRQAMVHRHENKHDVIVLGATNETTANPSDRDARYLAANSLRTTTPPFITNLTDSKIRTSEVGSPATAMMSA